MGDSPSHQLGEYIGKFFEASVIRFLMPIMQEKGYYLDYRHARPARKNNKEVIGIDIHGNKHKLDIVIEKNGTEEAFGVPRAYIEVAWRRYTKHSKNKVQEISGAILPLVESSGYLVPFYAAVLAGEFTGTALRQLESEGFYVLHIGYDELCAVFETIGISIRWGEQTPDEEIESILASVAQISSEQYEELMTLLIRRNKGRFMQLVKALNASLDKTVDSVTIMPIHGSSVVMRGITEAIEFIMEYDEQQSQPIMRYEITVRFSNGDEYTMKCQEKREAIRLLNVYR